MQPVEGSGIVYLVGAGPGDPGLFTLKGKACLERAEVVIYDRLANPRLLDLAPEDAEKIYVGKRTGRHTVDQAGINRIILAKAKEGKIVVRLKGGDPFIFGRGGEEAQVLADAGIPFEVVPGVTSAIAVPAYAGVPLTHRSFTASVAFITGHRKDETDADVDWENLAKGVGTLVFLMGVKNLPRIAENLIRFGRPPETPVVVTRWGTTPNHVSIDGTLADIADKVEKAGLKPPAIIVVGEVASLRKKIAWFEKRPLLGRGVLVTRAREQVASLMDMLEQKGARCIPFPVIETVLPEDTSPLDKEIENIGTYDWIVFTSVNAVHFFMSRVRGLGLDVRVFGGLKIAVVGSQTQKALGDMGITPDLIPQRFQQEGLLEAFSRVVSKEGEKILYPRAAVVRPGLEDGLKAMGFKVVSVVAYETRAPEPSQEDIERLSRERVDCVIFTSSSTVENFQRMVPEPTCSRILKNARIACIGPVTRKTLEGYGFTPSIQPKVSTIPDLVKEIEEAFSR